MTCERLACWACVSLCVLGSTPGAQTNAFLYDLYARRVRALDTHEGLLQSIPDQCARPIVQHEDETLMRFYTQQHQYYCGIDLHARSMYRCILDQSGAILLHRNMRANSDAFLKAVAPYREDEGTDEFLGCRERLVLPCITESR